MDKPVEQDLVHQSVEIPDPQIPDNSASRDLDDTNTFPNDTLGYFVMTFFVWIVPINPLDSMALCVSSVIYMLLDPLFLYIPLINEDLKCVMVDNKLKIAALVLRSFSDLRYLVRIIFRIKDGWQQESPSPSLKKKAMSIAFDVVSLLPIPQVVVLIFLPNMRVSSSLKIIKFLNSLILLQYLTRVYPLSTLYTEPDGNEAEKNKIKTQGGGLLHKPFAIIMYFYGFLLASHVLGAFWYFFSIQREIDCWEYAGGPVFGRKFSISCEDNTFRNITLINSLCPINPPDESIFNFGIFLYALQSGMQGSTNFPQKFFQCFSWGVRNLSSFASNLDSSSYIWESLFVVLISISGLVLFMFLLGNVQTFMQQTDGSYGLRVKWRTIEPKIQPTLLKYGISDELVSKVKRVVKARVERGEDLTVENMLMIISSDLVDVKEAKDLDQVDVKEAKDLEAKEVKEAKDLAMEIKCSLFMDKLKTVDGLEDKKEAVLKEICKYLQPMIYDEESYIIRKEEPLTKMFFVTWGNVLTFRTNKGGSNGSSITTHFENERDGLYGEELLTWAKNPSSKLSHLPICDITTKSYDKVEIFALKATDLKKIFSKFQ